MKGKLHPLTKAIIVLGYIVLICFMASQYFAGRAPKWDLTIPMMSPIEFAIDAYHLNTGQYPKTLNDLIKCPAGLENVWAGPYLKEKQLIDPWGYEYKYELGYRLLSYGKDGKPNGKGYDADQEHFTPITPIK
jgi:general secretion pathway protein G